MGIKVGYQINYFDAKRILYPRRQQATVCVVREVWGGRERESCVCVCERERVRKRDSCACVCVCVCRGTRFVSAWSQILNTCASLIVGCMWMCPNWNKANNVVISSSQVRLKQIIFIPKFTTPATPANLETFKALYIKCVTRDTPIAGPPDQVVRLSLALAVRVCVSFSFCLSLSLYLSLCLSVSHPLSHLRVQHSSFLHSRLVN
jgi:hypothetical protein